MGRAVRSAALLLLGATAVAVAGCGGAGETATPASLRLQREDLTAVSRALQRLKGPIDREVAATKTAWGHLANGLPAGAPASTRPAVATAAESAAAIRLPALLEEAQTTSLTGPASQLAGLVRSYSALVTTSWKLIGAAIDESAHGSPSGARFARENVALYIESVYDAHFELAQIGGQLRAAYRRLGGERAFGSALTQAEVDALAGAYSEPTDRLHPHVGVRLGS